MNEPQMGHKSIGELIDRLCIVNLKIWNLVDIIETSDDDKKVANCARGAQKLNRERSQLVNEINKIFGNEREDIKI